MTAATLLVDLCARGFALKAAGPDLEIRGPKSVWTPILQQSVREHKADLLALLTTEAAPEQAAGARNPCVEALVADLLVRGVVFAEREGRLLWFAPFPVTTTLAATLHSRRGAILERLRKLPARSSGCWSRRSWGDPTLWEIENLVRRIAESATAQREKA